ncbi:MAG: hypothetical protein HW387_72 [Parachlamydiales bacterium]|nr:hypothetical protein [Parachlamydiales bacterium]
MGQYYYVISAFPPIGLGAKPEMTYEMARQMLKLNLTEPDWHQIVLFQRATDIRNIRALWLQAPIDPRGNFQEKELEDALLVQECLPTFVVQFLDRYDNQEERLRYFPSLMASLYHETLPELKGFLLSYYRLEREIRLSLTALRAKVQGVDLARELQFEDPEDPFIAELLARKDDNESVIPEEYEDLKRAFLENRTEPRKLYRSILQLRLSRIDDLEVGQTFSMDQVLGHLARLFLVESWERLDDEKGRLVLEKIC